MKTNWKKIFVFHGNPLTLRKHNYLPPKVKSEK